MNDVSFLPNGHASGRIANGHSLGEGTHFLHLRRVTHSTEWLGRRRRETAASAATTAEAACYLP